MAKIKQFSEAVWLAIEKRVQSLLWRTGMMTLAILVDVALVNLEVLELDGFVVLLLGLVLGEISKFIAKRLKEK